MPDRERLYIRPLIIASGQPYTADYLPLAGALIVGIYLPAAWDAAALTVQATPQQAASLVYYDLWTETAEYSLPAAASRYLRVLPEDFAGVFGIRFRSGTGSAPVNQTANRTLQIILRDA